MSLYYAYFQNYWEQYHKVTFDGINRLIIINQGEEEIDVQRDIYSAWKEWSLVETNAKFPQALEVIGGEPLTVGQSLDATYFLINGWRLKPFAGSYTLNITGNIFEVDGDDIFIPADVVTGIANNININTNRSAIVRRIDGGGSIEDIEEYFDEQNETLFNIENRIISIQNTNQQILNKLSEPLEATLAQPDAEKLDEILDKIVELWKIHGLSPDPLLVNKTKRQVADIEQTFTSSGDDVIVNRTS